MAKLTTKARKALPKSTFAIPATRSYPIPDKAHAIDALSRVTTNGTPAQKAQVQKAVAAKFKIGPAAKPPVKAAPRKKK